MAVIRNLVVKIAADISGLSKGLQQAQSKLMSMSNSLSGIGTNLSLKITAPLILLGKTALNTSADFEQSMANAASVSGLIFPGAAHPAMNPANMTGNTKRIRLIMGTTPQNAAVFCSAFHCRARLRNLHAR